MAPIVAEIIVLRPPEEVFLFLADGEALPRWLPDFDEVEQLHPRGPIGRGTTYRYVLTRSRARSTWSWTVVEPYTRLAWKGASVRTIAPFNTMRPSGSYELAPVEGGTRVRATIVTEYRGLMRLVSGLADRNAAETWQANLERLKQIVESGA